MNTIQQSMNSAVAAFQRGDFENARAIAQRVHRDQPRNMQVLQFLGIAQCKAGNPREGLASLQRALRSNPQDSALRLNAAQAALDAGLPAEAEELCRPIASQPQALQVLALAAKARGDVELAATRLEELTRTNPRDGRLLNNYGNALLECGEAERAIEVLATAGSLIPDEAGVWLNLGRALTLAKRFDDAEAVFSRAIATAPQDAQTNFELGQSLYRHGRAAEALIRFSAAARAGRQDAQTLVLIGLCYAALDQKTEAERAYKTGLAVEPDSVRAMLALAILYEQGNRLTDLEDLEALARRNAPPSDDRAYIEALTLRRRGNLREALDLALASHPATLDTSIRAQFIGQVADQLGEVDLAFASFSEMNEAMAAQPDALRFDGTEQSTVISGRTAAISAPWFAGWNDVEYHDGLPSPAFLTGFLRSGTTLLDTILMGHPDTEVREEEAMVSVLEETGGPIAQLGTLDAEAVSRMRAGYFDEVSRGGTLPDGKLLIDKYPLATLRASYIHRAFPDARFIFALRHPCDVVLSCWMQNFKVTRAMASFLTLENAARMYALTMEHWMRAREVMPLRVHTVRYEDLVQDLEGTMRPLLDFLGLDWTDDVLDHQRTAANRGYIRTPSYAQVTERIYTRSKGRWEAYRPYLEPVLPILEPWIDRFGYEPL
ncbi:sulfotransferase [Novosphingobium colocasiae]|uniref:tetratricopeptide repeat-containing sulfotransferase family protein n=1 Tax=Novosphingobium colocasiae TaxID=1256513 RepID=UPI0035ADC23A